eukprot:sb/3479686/
MSAADFDDFLSSVTSTPAAAAVIAPVEAPVVAPAPATNGEVSSMGGLFGGMTLQPQHPVSLMQQPPQQATLPPPTNNNSDFSDALGLFSEPQTTSNTAPAPVSGNLLDDLFGLSGTGGGGGLLEPTLQPTVQPAIPVRYSVAADLESTTLINLDEGEPSSQTMSAADFDDFLSSVTTSTTSPAAVVAPVEAQVVAPAPATNGEVSSMGGLFGGMTLQPQHPVSLMQQPPQQATPPPPTNNNSDFSDALGLFSEPLTTTNPAPTPVSGNLLDDLFGLGGTGGGGGLLEPTLQPTVQPAIPVAAVSYVEEPS